MIAQHKQTAGYLIFNRIQVQNANAISSPITYGFPAVSGFLGAIHAMSRKLQQQEELSHLSFDGVLIASHQCEVKSYRQNIYSDYTFNQTRNPIKKDGSTASIIEEGKCNLIVSLVVEVKVDDVFDVEDSHIEKLVEMSQIWIQQQRLAGGSVLGLRKVNPVRYLSVEDKEKIKSLLLPAFVLVNAQQELIEITKVLQENDPKMTALDALLEVSTLHHIPEQNKKGGIEWKTTSVKTERGWLVPIPIGFQGISDFFAAGIMQNCRNPEYSSQYVEAIYSLGKWVFPFRIDDIDLVFWHYHYDQKRELYLTIQPNQLEYI